MLFCEGINFPNKSPKFSTRAIDNNFIDIVRRYSSSLYPIMKGISDHAVQSITLKTKTFKPLTR